MLSTSCFSHRKNLLRFLLLKTAAVRRGVKPGELLRVRRCFTAETENGDRIVTFKGTMYWPKNKPTQSDSITVAATGYDTKEQKETEPSNALTVRFGENVKKETQSGTNG